MTKIAAVFCLLLLTAPAHAAPSQAAPAPPLILTLPSDEAYSYWVQSKSGPVGMLPVTVSHKKTVPVAAPVTTGDHLFVMDAHSGEVASRQVSISLSGAPLPMTFTLSDFHAVSAPIPTATTAVPPAGEKKEGDKEDGQEDSRGSGVTRLLTGLFSLLLAGGVAWVVLQLIKTRGEPLRQIARRVGIEVADPNEMTPDAAAATAEPPTYASQKRTPEAVPDEASLPPKLTTARLGRGPELPLSEVPALLGLQGLAAGSTFALTDGDVTVGRDGDNEIVLAENTVSRRHARLLRDSHGQFTLTDLGSANGVYINGTRVQRAILTSGDEIKIGDNYFRFQAAKEAV